jgi:hypothetical protein
MSNAAESSNDGKSPTETSEPSGSLFMKQLFADMSAAGQVADQQTKDDLKKRFSESVDHGDNRKKLLAMLTDEAKEQDPEFAKAVEKALDTPGATLGSIADLGQQIVTKRQAEAAAKWRRDMERQKDMFDAMTEMRRQTLESQGYDLTGSIYDRKTGEYRRRD